MCCVYVHMCGCLCSVVCSEYNILLAPLDNFVSLTLQILLFCISVNILLNNEFV